MKASFGGDITSKIKPSKNVWMQDATMKDLSGTATLTKEDSLQLSSNLSNAGKIFKKIAATTLKEIESNKELNMVINIF